MFLSHLLCANADGSPAEPMPLLLHKTVCCVVLFLFFLIDSEQAAGKRTDEEAQDCIG